MLVGAVLAAASISLFAAPAANADPATVTGGETQLRIHFQTVLDWSADNIFSSALPPATLDFFCGCVKFPVTGGVIDDANMTGTVQHSGGLRIVKYNADQTAVENQLDTTEPQIINGSIFAANVMGLPIPSPSGDITNTSISPGNVPGEIVFTGEVHLQQGTAIVLNTFFNTNVFVAGQLLGVLTSRIQTQPLLEQPGTINIVKDARPNDPQDFGFTAGGGLSPTSFTLDDDSDGTFSNTRTFQVVAGSGYNVSETVPSGWMQNSATCSDGSPVSNIDVGPGETVTCTFVNTRTYPRPGGGSPARVSLVPEYAECTLPNSKHVEPLDLDSCSPPTLASSLLTTSTTGIGSGSAKVEVVPGLPSTPADEADVLITATASDVRLASDGSDYAGQLALSTGLRVTDRRNGPAGDEPATAEDFQFSMPFNCVPTGGTSGSTCTLATTADTVLPGFAAESKRTVISAFSLAVEDAGANGSFGSGCPLDCGDGDEGVFLRQGLFTP
jgi:hypothetical protein